MIVIYVLLGIWAVGVAYGLLTGRKFVKAAIGSVIVMAGILVGTAVAAGAVSLVQSWFHSDDAASSENVQSATQIEKPEVVTLPVDRTFSIKAKPTMNMLVEALDAKKLIVGLPLSNRKVTTSGDYKKKQLWDITGFDNSTLEIIGNDQSDADVMAWTCREYDATGSALNAARPESSCRQLLIDVLRKLVDNPIELANYIVSQTADPEKSNPYLESGPFAIEAGRDGFYFVRHRNEQDQLKWECGQDYHSPRVGMALTRAQRCLPGLRLTGQYNRADGLLSEYQVGRISLSVMDGQVVAWNRY